MKALFITTDTNDCANHVSAWNSFAPPAEHMTFGLQRHTIRNDQAFVDAASGHDVIFYIGPCGEPVRRTARMLRSLRDHAPVVMIVSDAGDAPWHGYLNELRGRDAFDLAVSIDGARDAPVDLAVLTPVDPGYFGAARKDIRCGFSGSYTSNRTDRRDIVSSLLEGGHVVTRRREPTGGYRDHAMFLCRCRMVLNVSLTGSGKAHHIKGRVPEAGWADCALLELAASPISAWFPEDCYFSYRDVDEAARLIRRLNAEQIAGRAQALSAYVRAHYRPDQIYGEMLAGVGLTLAQSAA